MMAGLENGSAKGKRRGGRHSRRRQGNESGTPDDKQVAYSSDEGHGSDFSSMSTSDDVELSRLASGDAMTDDEETGLTKKDKEHRKRKRRRNQRIDGRIAGNVKTSKQERKDADRNVLKAMIINVLLILAWYLFSLSISIVSNVSIEKQSLRLIDAASTTNGCSRKNTSTSISPFSRHACTCLSSSASLPWSYTSYLSYGHVQIASPTPTITTQSAETPHRTTSHL